MDLKQLSDTALDCSFQNYARREHEILVAVLHHINEATNRESFMGCKNLFEYLTEHLKYSNGTAQARLDAARLLKEFPKIGNWVKDRDIHLTQLTDLAKSLRKAGKVTHEQKSKILEDIKGKDVAASQTLMAKALNIDPIKKDKCSKQADGSTRVETTLTTEQEAFFQKAKEMMSHTNPNPTLAEAFEYLAKKVFKPAQKRKSNNPRYVQKHVRQETCKKHDGCQWIDPITKKRCGSHFRTEVDHKQPLWAGGTSEPENLQILCQFHNKLKYQIEMEHYYGMTTS